MLDKELGRTYYQTLTYAVARYQLQDLNRSYVYANSSLLSSVNA